MNEYNIPIIIITKNNEFHSLLSINTIEPRNKLHEKILNESNIYMKKHNIEKIKTIKIIIKRLGYFYEVWK